MLRLPAELLRHLSQGGTLVAPTRQRAAALSAAFGAAMLEAGRSVWESPDILSWSGWLDRELSAARARHEPVPRRLTGAGEWLLWREAVEAAGSGLGLIAPELLVDEVRRASRLLDDHALTLPEDLSHEAALLAQAQQHFRRRCRELDVLDAGSWRVCSRWIRPTARLWFSGFGAALGAAVTDWLTAGEAVIDERRSPPPDHKAPGGRIVALADAALEAEAAAAWCAGTLARDREARLLVVVPRLRERHHLWQHALACALDAAAILQPDELAAPSAFVIEGGEPLSVQPLVAAALSAISVATGEAEFTQWSALLRSPFFAALPRRECLRLELWQRERNIDTGQPAALRALLPTIANELGREISEPLQQLLHALEAAGAGTGALDARARRDVWARSLAALLGRLGWASAGRLDESALSAKQRFEELLGEFAGAEPLDERLSLGEAVALLQRLAARAAIEPPLAEAAVTLTASLDDPIVQYDGLWAAGLCAAAWPQPARPDGWIPLPLQLRAGIAVASAAGQLQRARDAQRHWLQASTDCVLSWTRSEDDLPQDASALLLEIAVADPSLSGVAAVPAASIERRLAALAPALYHVNDGFGPPWPARRQLRGGTKLLELQSLCPFRAFGELRLRARPLEEPTPGIDARQRGRIVHRALELFWAQIGDLAGLLALTQSDLQRLAQQCAVRAIDEIARAAPESLQSVLVAREGARTAELIGHLVAWERTRAPFAAQELEVARALTIGESALRVRLDRVDRLEDGRLVVIDYKSGRARRFDPDEARPKQPQLPAYASVLGGEVAAVLAIHLGAEGIELVGFADRIDRLSGLTTAARDDADWRALQDRWGAVVQGLAREFIDGYAPVIPQRDACDQCHLQVLCRIGESGVP